MPCICWAEAKDEEMTKYAINSHCKAIAELMKALHMKGDTNEDWPEVAKKAIQHHFYGCDEKKGEPNGN